MDIKQLQRDFINDEVWILTFGGAFRRANIYSDGPSDQARQDFKSFIRCKVEKLFAKAYGDRVVDGDEHIKNIELLKIEIGDRYSSILIGGRITFGVVQKILNLYLKHQWCMGRSKMPPHCPVDRIMLAKTNISPLPNWTTMDSPAEYRSCIEALEQESAKKGQKLAEWELSEFNKRQD